MWTKTLRCSVVPLDHKKNVFSKITCTYGLIARTRYGSKKKVGRSMRKRKSNDLEPHFQTSATMSRSLREGMKTAAALPHCSESTEESIGGWCTFGLEGRLELWQNYELSYTENPW
ncbi:unnamed protein product [Laminaria digitata]